MGKPELFLQRGICLGLFHGIEVFTLDVLDERELERVIVRYILYYDRNPRDACQSAGMVSTLSGNYLVPGVELSNQNRREEAVKLYGLGEFREFS